MVALRKAPLWGGSVVLEWGLCCVRVGAGWKRNAPLKSRLKECIHTFPGNY